MTDPIIDSIFEIINGALTDPSTGPPSGQKGAEAERPTTAENTHSEGSGAASVPNSAEVFDAIYEAVNEDGQAAVPHKTESIVSMDVIGFPEWQPAMESIASTGGTILITGGPDSGKTTFARHLLRLLIANGRTAAHIDADLRQGDVGPPACIGLSLQGPQTGGVLKPTALAFVGALSPQRRFLEYSSGLRLLLDRTKDECREYGANRIGVRDVVIDVGGLAVGGSASMRQANVLLNLIKPAHVVVLRRREKHAEHQDLIAAASRRTGCALYTPRVAAAIQRKNSVLKSKRLVTQFASYFESSEVVTVGFDDVTILGTWLGGARPLASHLLKFVSNSIGPAVRVYYGEQCDRHLGIMVDRSISDAGTLLGLVHDQLKTNAATVTEAPRLKHLLVGLEDGNGAMLGLGLVEALDFNRRTMGIQTPMRSPLAARAIHFSEMRVQPDGAQLGMLRRGEL